jgi:fructose-1,6-bisphosphatase/inositol monophosphatase family enzyme
VTAPGREAADGSHEALHALVRDLAEEAGRMQLARVEDPGFVREKKPKDVVTEVDLLVEEFLVGEIQRRYPDDAILAEERGGGVSEDGRTWLLDPVDGTANFSRANPMFCCCVSILEGGRVTHAAVAAPRLGDVYHASLGRGAFLDSRGQTRQLRVRGTEALEYAFVGADLSFMKRQPNEAGLQRVFGRCWQLRQVGSAGIRGAWTSAGYLDVSLSTNNTAWDSALATLLVGEAGGRVTDLDGSPWTFDSGGLLATGSAALHEEVLATLNG